MKTLTFFNEKGGTGKTTFTVLMASWLYYKMHESVAVYDCDFPSYQLMTIRNSEMELLTSRPDAQLARFVTDGRAYGIAKAMGRDAFSKDQLKYITQQIAQTRAKSGGYLLLDFPGRFLQNDPVWHLAAAKLLDLVVFPIDTDQQSRAAALNTYYGMKRINPEQKAVFLWNRETASERRGRRDWYAESTRLFRDIGIPVLDTRMREILLARRDSSTFGFVRSTLCWPQANIDHACPYIETIFSDIKGILDNKEVLGK